jgi:2-oxo-3-hexenedioate decarboxylase
MEKNGEIVTLGAAAAVLGHPADAVAMLVNILPRWARPCRPAASS